LLQIHRFNVQHDVERTSCMRLSTHWAIETKCATMFQVERPATVGGTQLVGPLANLLQALSLHNCQSKLYRGCCSVVSKRVNVKLAVWRATSSIGESLHKLMDFQTSQRCNVALTTMTPLLFQCDTRSLTAVQLQPCGHVHAAFLLHICTSVNGTRIARGTLFHSAVHHPRFRRRCFFRFFFFFFFVLVRILAHNRTIQPVVGWVCACDEFISIYC
jgi:hypothetical protein